MHLDLGIIRIYKYLKYVCAARVLADFALSHCTFRWRSLPSNANRPRQKRKTPNTRCWCNCLLWYAVCSCVSSCVFRQCWVIEVVYWRQISRSHFELQMRKNTSLTIYSWLADRCCLVTCLVRTRFCWSPWPTRWLRLQKMLLCCDFTLF